MAIYIYLFWQFQSSVESGLKAKAQGIQHVC